MSNSGQFARTAPSDKQHFGILFKRACIRDVANPRFLLAKILLAPALLMLWTMGIFITSEQKSMGQQVGDYILYPASSWSYPDRALLGAPDNVSNVEAVRQQLLSFIAEVDVVTISQNSSHFESICMSDLNRTNVCIFINSYLSYSLFFSYLDQSDPRIVGAQRAMNTAMLQANLQKSHIPVNSIQQIPSRVRSISSRSYSAYMVPIVLILANSLASQITGSNVVLDNSNGVVSSFMLVGVKLRIYLLAVVLQLIAMIAPFSAGAMTFVVISWRIWDESNAMLIFISHFLFMVQLSALLTMSSRLAVTPSQVQFASALPLLTGLLALIIGLPLIISTSTPSLAVLLLTPLSPFFGLISYAFIYGDAQSTGGIGIRDLTSSGLLTSFMVQLMSILIWAALIFVTSSPRFLRSQIRAHLSNVHFDINRLNDDRFEPLSADAEVVVSIRGLSVTFPGTHQAVLKGLNMDVCRGEVLGFLGHNGAGKTTTIRILSGELMPTSGDATYTFADGCHESIVSGNIGLIRGRIGVCPQHNLHVGDSATCRETLQLFALLKGRIRQEPNQNFEEAVAAEVNRCIADLAFTSPEDADKPVATFSGGMRRKLSIAIALLGDPEVVFLDEPTAGVDPFNRRQIWDMIIAAKEMRGVVLTTHFMDEADVLSDRIAIIRDGSLAICGSSLFLKHQLGAGYTLSFEGSIRNDVVGLHIPGAKDLGTRMDGMHQFQLPHGSEASYPALIAALNEAGADKLSMEITTLEQVFLDLGQQVNKIETVDGLLVVLVEPAPRNAHREVSHDENNNLNSARSTNGSNSSQNAVGHPRKDVRLAKIWKPIVPMRPVSCWFKLFFVSRFLMDNWSRTPGQIFLNIVQPVLFIVGSFVTAKYLDAPSSSLLMTLPNVPLIPSSTGSGSSRFFGLVDELAGHSISPMIATAVPTTIDDYFTGLPVTGGYWAPNQTLQYSGVSMALQVAEQVLANAAMWNQTEAREQQGTSLNASLVRLPYVSSSPFRIDLILVPMGVSFGLAAMGYSVLDILILKDNKSFCLFRVAGIAEFSVYVAVFLYKMLTCVVPAIILIIVLGLALQSVLLGNAGRWLCTILLLFFYPFATAPMGFLMANVLISDFNSAQSWFPGVYMTLMTLPYAGYAVSLQIVSQSSLQYVLLAGKIAAVLPPFAFQCCLIGLMQQSVHYSDPVLSWSVVWIDNELFYFIIIMSISGTAQWALLYRMSSRRPAATKLDPGGLVVPIDVSGNLDVAEERDRSRMDNAGIRVRDIVKKFRVFNRQGKRVTTIKTALVGVSFGINANEVYAVVGPNGSGKSTTMKILTGELQPEHGEFVLNGQRCTTVDTSTDKLFADAAVSYCPQFDALFLHNTVMEHLHFYSTIRGLEWDSPATQQHIDAIMDLLGLRQHVTKRARELSGGYRRRLSLGIAMVGFPRAMLVDEVTTGLDPDARHLVLAALRPDAQNRDYDLPAILLSTHYMDEASKLGTRIGIMIDGALVATGTLPRLNERFSNSYYVEVVLRLEAPADFLEGLMAAFLARGMQPSVSEVYSHRVKLRLPFIDRTRCAETRQLAAIFDLLETNRESLCIRFYSVARTTLEQIFIEQSRLHFSNHEINGA